MERKSVQTLVYEELKKNIMSMRLEPGQAMSTQEMATRLNVSRTPVREAFLQLQSEGLVDIIPQRETTVSRIDLKRVSQEKFIRECLEYGAINKFLEEQNTEALSRMKALVEYQMQYAEERNFVGFLEADDSFHRILFDATNQEMAWMTIASTNGHYNRLRILFIQEAGVMESSIGQHSRIVTLLEHGEEDGVRNALMSHIKRFNVDETAIVAKYPDYFYNKKTDSRERQIGSL